MDHGHPDNFLLSELQAAAKAGGTPTTVAAWNIPRTLMVAAEPGWPPQPFHTATRPTLVWDVDGVLAFTAEAAVMALNARYGTTYDVMTQRFFPGTLIGTALPAEQAAWLAAQLTDPVVLRQIAPDWHAIDTMTGAAAAGYTTTIVTERPPGTGNATRQWLAAWGCPDVPPVVAVGRGAKPAYMAARFGPAAPAVLIDDNPAARVSIARNGIQVWSPQRPYTPKTRREHTRTFGAWPEARYWLGIAPG
jgi:hypothetical protein